MKIRIKLNAVFASEIALIFLVWLISVWVSSPVFNRPLGDLHEWLTAHTLVSMRAFEEWGFWKLLGASILIPHSNEFIGVDITSFTKTEGIYLSYPSLWIVLPYTTFKLLNLLPLDISLSSFYLQFYNLIVNRLFCGIVIYYLYLEIVKILNGKILTDYTRRLLAFLGLIGWMFTPPVMYWTQNVYGPDQAVLLPIYIIFLISLRCKFRFEDLSQPSQVLLVIAAICACGIDWYGWVSVAVILFVVLIDKWLSRNETFFSFKGFLKQYLNSIKFLFTGMLVAGITFLAQILYYKDGLTQLSRIFLVRSGATMVSDDGDPLTNFQILRRILWHWIPYFPQIVRQPVGTYGTKVVLVTVLLIIFISLGFLYYLFRTSQDRRLSIYVYVLVFLVPLLQLYILKQHSFTHNFSAFKMGLAISCSLLVLPVLLLTWTFKNTFAKSIVNYHQSNTYTSIFFVALGLVIIFSTISTSGITKFAGSGINKNQDLGFLVTRNIAADDLPIANQDPLFLDMDPFPHPLRLWYTKRFIYSPDSFKNLRSQGKLNLKNIKRMKPIFLAFRDEPLNANVSSLCQGKWIDLGEKVDAREVIACRTPELNRLFD